ncbi:AP-1 complex subunit sigma-2-like isoform X2 [Osmerus eperlanus]|uniref:AP-1 complex subunit sigma-2-like isoform X2 n=1 Tax=Osmerus eperlanus TaxID=29151 RepID=UPI002E14E270
MKIPRVREVKKRNKPCEKPVRVQAHLTFMYRTHKEICPVNSKFPGVPRRLSTEYCQQVGLEAARLSKMNRCCVISRVEMQFMLLFSRQGKLRLQKWYVPLSDKEKKKITRELVQTVLSRKPKMCSFLEWRDLKIVYKRYASLYFCCGIEDQDNELITLEIIHRYVELLDKYFGSVCELDIIFNFEKAYFILDEFLLGGEAQETSKKNVLKAIEQADLLQEETETPRSVLEEIGLT